MLSWAWGGSGGGQLASNVAGALVAGVVGVGWRTSKKRTTIRVYLAPDGPHSVFSLDVRTGEGIASLPVNVKLLHAVHERLIDLTGRVLRRRLESGWALPTHDLMTAQAHSLRL